MTLEFSPRLVNIVILDAKHHISYHWDPAALARWTSLETVVSFTLELRSAAQENLAGGRWEFGEARSRLEKNLSVM